MNSSLEVSNEIHSDKDLTSRIKTLVRNAGISGTRAFMFVHAPQNGWLEHFAREHSSVYLDSESATDRADRISSMLGSEQAMVAVQLGNRPDLGLLAAVAGTIRAGGLLVIATAPESDFTAGRSASSEATADASGPSLSSSRLSRIALQAAARHPDTMLYVRTEPHELDHKWYSSKQSTPDSPLFPSDNGLRGGNPEAIAEQKALLDNACKHLDTPTRSCVSIKGRRGRGKSTLLARVAHFLELQKTEYRITAFHDSAMSVYRLHAPAISRYISPEAAATNPPDTLLIEEAASFPLPLLQIYLNTCRRVVLCTTTEGYESSGRAIDIRLLADWTRTDMPLLQLEARHPWRWASMDPLEQYVDQLLLKPTGDLACNPDPGYWSDPARQAGQCRVTHLSHDELHSNDKLLATVQAFLLSTHYQSTTKDLEHLLDAPTIEVWVQRHGNSIAAILILEHEGSIEKSLHEAIVSKTRRLHHQLLPQLLAQTANNSLALEKRYVRIIRLAVAPPLRRQGLASDLLQTVLSMPEYDLAVDAPDSFSKGAAVPGSVNPCGAINAIGASFAADPSSLAFWQSQGFTEFHRGFRANPRTGDRAVAVLKCFDPGVGAVLTQAARINNDNEAARTADSATLNAQEPSPIATRITRLDKNLLIRFAAGERSKHDTYAALQRLAMNTPLPMQLQQQQSQRLHERELRQCVQKWLGMK